MNASANTLEMFALLLTILVCGLVLVGFSYLAGYADGRRTPKPPDRGRPEIPDPRQFKVPKR